MMPRYMGSFIIKIYETSKGNFIKRVSGELYNFSGTSFIKVYVKVATSLILFLSHDFSASMYPSLDTLSTGFLHVPA